MNQDTTALYNQLAQLTGINEELLRSKGKLLQQVIELKKKLEAEEKNKRHIEQLQEQINGLNKVIVDHLLNRSAMAAEIEELKRNLSLMELLKENALDEIDRLNKRKWHHLLFRKK